MNIKCITLVSLALMAAAIQAAPQPKTEKTIQQRTSAISQKLKSFFNDEEKRQLNHLVKSMLFFGGAYGTHKVASYTPAFIAIFGDILAAGMGIISVEHLVRAICPYLFERRPNWNLYTPGLRKLDSQTKSSDAEQILSEEQMIKAGITSCKELLANKKTPANVRLDVQEQLKRLEQALQDPAKRDAVLWPAPETNF